MLTWTIKRAFVSCRTGIYAFFRGIYAYFPGKYVHMFGFKMHKVQKMPKVVQLRSCGEKPLKKQKSRKLAFIRAFSRMQISYTIWYNTMQYNTLQHNTIQCNRINFNYNMIQYIYIYIYGDDLLGLFCSYVHMSTHVLSCRKKLAELHGLAGPHWKSIVQLPVRTGIVGGGRATKASIHVQVSWRVVRQGSLSCGLTLKPFSLLPLVFFYCR